MAGIVRGKYDVRQRKRAVVEDRTARHALAGVAVGERQVGHNQRLSGIHLEMPHLAEAVDREFVFSQAGNGQIVGNRKFVSPLIVEINGSARERRIELNLVRATAGRGVSDRRVAIGRIDRLAERDQPVNSDVIRKRVDRIQRRQQPPILQQLQVQFLVMGLDLSRAFDWRRNPLTTISGYAEFLASAHELNLSKTLPKLKDR